MNEQTEYRNIALMSAAVAIAVVCLLVGWIARAVFMADDDRIREVNLQSEAVIMGYAEWVDHNGDSFWNHYREFRWKAKP